MRHEIYTQHRHPRTHNEAVQNEGCELVRAKRKPKNLANAYDDIPQDCIETRKDYHKEKHRGRGKKYTMLFDHWKPAYLLEQYFKRHNIPFKCQQHKRWLGSFRITWWTDKEIGLEYILKEWYG
jgi:hypothetical protein